MSHTPHTSGQLAISRFCCSAVYPKLMAAKHEKPFHAVHRSPRWIYVGSSTHATGGGEGCGGDGDGSGKDAGAGGGDGGNGDASGDGDGRQAAPAVD